MKYYSWFVCMESLHGTVGYTVRRTKFETTISKTYREINTYNAISVTVSAKNKVRESLRTHFMSAIVIQLQTP